jgi:hypothetical protein
MPIGCPSSKAKPVTSSGAKSGFTSRKESASTNVSITDLMS